MRPEKQTNILTQVRSKRIMSPGQDRNACMASVGYICPDVRTISTKFRFTTAQRTKWHQVFAKIVHKHVYSLGCPFRSTHSNGGKGQKGHPSTPRLLCPPICRPHFSILNVVPPRPFDGWPPTLPLLFRPAGFIPQHYIGSVHNSFKPKIVYYLATFVCADSCLYGTPWSPRCNENILQKEKHASKVALCRHGQQRPTWHLT